ncbi:MAG: hypothetical protein ACOZCL_19340 [Bacillota bacterium]
MFRFFKLIHKETKPLPLILILFYLCTWFYMQYTQREIHYEYEGVMFQKNNLEDVVPLNIYIDGKYTIDLFVGNDEFSGKLIIGEYVFEECSLKFNKRGMASLEMNPFDRNSSEFNGMIFISRLFKEFTIEVFEQADDGVYKPNGILISAPSKKRNEAVRIANKLMGRALRGYRID